MYLLERIGLLPVCYRSCLLRPAALIPEIVRDGVGAGGHMNIDQFRQFEFRGWTSLVPSPTMAGQ
jgi:hypothetical protein